MEMYEFEKHLAKNEMSMEVVNARRFGVAVHNAMELLRREAGIYKLTAKPYYLDTMAELEKMAARLTAEAKAPLEWEPMTDEVFHCRWYRCPRCKRDADEHPTTGEPWFRNYCPECGQRLMMPAERNENNG